MIAMIDYNAGNLKSVEKALLYLGQECTVTRDFREIEKADKVILPGVGAFGDAMEQLKKYELDKVIREVTDKQKAEAELDKSGHLYCLGDIVHNSDEVERLKNKGLVTITHDDLRKLHNVKVLLRAHGEPPETYAIARDNGIEIIDATCPVVLKLQRRIHARYIDSEHPNTQIVIYGKLGHAEVNGLVGQTNGEAVVVENIDGLDRIDYSRDIALYSQTTKSLQGFKEIEKEISHRIRELDSSWCRVPNH